MAMCTNGSGTNSVKPPVSFCRSRVRTQVAGPVLGLLDRAEHDRDVRAQADGVGGAVRSSHSSVLILSGQRIARTSSSRISAAVPGQRAQPGVHEPPQVVGQRLAEALGALGDLERGEAVHVDVGRGLLHGPGDVDVVVAVEVGVDAALQADLGGAELGAPRRARSAMSSRVSR